MLLGGTPPVLPAFIASAANLAHTLALERDWCALMIFDVLITIVLKI